MAIKTPTTQGRQISGDVGRTENIGTGAANLHQAMGQFGRDASAISTEILRRRKNVQTQNFAIEARQEYLTNRLDKVQELETKYDGTDGEGYFKELTAWEGEQDDRIRKAAPTSDALSAYNSTISAKREETLVS